MKTATMLQEGRATVKNLDGSLTEYDDIPLEKGTLWKKTSSNGSPKAFGQETLAQKSSQELGTLVSLCRDLFVENWNRIRFGPCVQGAVFELTLREKPKVFSILDGYLTVEFTPGPDHFHLCLGETKGLGKRKTPKELSEVRQCRRAAFFRDIAPDTGAPRSWGIRLWNGKGEQMITLFLPNAYLSDNLKRQKPDWSRLALWNELRKRYLGERESQPIPSGTEIPEHG